MDAYMEDDIRRKSMNAVQLVLSKCDDFVTLETFLTSSAPAEIMTHILDKISKVFFIFKLFVGTLSTENHTL